MSRLPHSRRSTVIFYLRHNRNHASPFRIDSQTGRDGRGPYANLFLEEASKAEAPESSPRNAFGGGHVSVQTTERYLGCKQRLRNAVKDRIGLEPANS